MIKFIFLTAVRGCDKNLHDLYQVIQPTMSQTDLWIIVHDNQEAQHTKNLIGVNVKILKNYANPGAGNTRNIGLDYIIKNVHSPFILFPIDADDQIVPDTLILAKEAFAQFSENIISFGHEKNFRKHSSTIGWDRTFNINEQLKRYRTPCGSTFVKFKEGNDLKLIRFGSRKRANDQLFFLSALKKFKTFRCIKYPILIYNMNNSKSVSRNKFKMPIYKFLALRDFGLGYIQTVYFMMHYIFVGAIRHILKLPY